MVLGLDKGVGCAAGSYPTLSACTLKNGVFHRMKTGLRFSKETIYHSLKDVKQTYREAGNTINRWRPWRTAEYYTALQKEKPQPRM